VRIERADGEDIEQHSYPGGERLGQLVAVHGMPPRGTDLMHVVVLRAPARYFDRRVHAEFLRRPPGDVEGQFEPVVAGVVQRDPGIHKQQVKVFLRRLRRLSPIRIPMPHRPIGSCRVAVEFVGQPAQLPFSAREVIGKPSPSGTPANDPAEPATLP
jgi:hypothetical protein